MFLCNFYKKPGKTSSAEKDNHQREEFPCENKENAKSDSCEHMVNEIHAAPLELFIQIYFDRDQNKRQGNNSVKENLKKN